MGGTDTDGAWTIGQTTDGGFITAGWSNSNNGDVTQNQGDSDYWIVKLTNDGLGVNDLNTNASNFILYPNPTNNQFIINSKSDIKDVRVYDIFGKLIKTFPAQSEYDVSGLAQGMYIINIESKKGTATQKLIIE